MSLLGTVLEDRLTKAQYVVYHTDGNNPVVPTNTKCAYLVCIDTRRGWFNTDPQRFVAIPLNSVDEFFTSNLTRRPQPFDPQIIVNPA